LSIHIITDFQAGCALPIELKTVVGSGCALQGSAKVQSSQA